MSILSWNRKSDEQLIAQLRKGKDAAAKALTDLQDKFETDILRKLHAAKLPEAVAELAVVDGIIGVAQLLSVSHSSPESFPPLNQLLWKKSLEALSEPNFFRAMQYMEGKDASDLMWEEGKLGVRANKFLTTYLMRVIGNKLSEAPQEEKEELLAEVIAAVIKNLQKEAFEGKSKLHTYIARIASNKVSDQIKQKKRKRNTEIRLEDFEIELPAEPDEEAEESKTQAEKVMSYFSQLKSKCKAILEVRKEGIPWEEVLEELRLRGVMEAELPPNTKALKNQWTRCRENLEKIMREQDPDLLHTLHRNRIKRGRK